MTDDSWPVEAIPDGDVLFYRIHRNLLVNGMVRANCFREQGTTGDVERPRSLSTDWSKYATPAETRTRATGPDENVIVAMPVGAVRAIEEVTVAHAPVAENRAHTDVIGVGRDPEIRDRLREVAQIVIPL